MCDKNLFSRRIRAVRPPHVPLADEYLIDAAPPTGALIKADNPTIVLSTQKDEGPHACSTWENAKVLAPGEMLGLRREGTFCVVSRINPRYP